MRPRLLVPFLLSALLAPLGCGDEDDETPDAGPATDTGSIVDAGGTEDVGPEDLGSADSGAHEGPRVGCDGAMFRGGPLESSATGPWPVGVRTVEAAGLRVEVWYPAVPGSESSTVAAQYDLRFALPDSEQGKIADADNPFLACDCFRDLPIDGDFGRYPVVIFVHGTGGVRYQSLAQVTHWASRGFVVVAADHPGLWLKDILTTTCGQGMVASDVPGDLRRLVEAVRTSTGALSFLSDRIDPSRIGMAGHSAGGGAIAGFGDVARVLAPLAAGGVEDGSALESTVVMGGTSDRVVPTQRQIDGYEASPGPKRLILLDEAGHLAFSVLCDLRNGAGQNIVQVAQAAGVCGLALAGALFDCNPDYLDDPEAWTIIDHATTAAFEATLQCRTQAEDQLSSTGAIFEAVSDFREEL